MAEQVGFLAREWPSRTFRAITGIWAIALAAFVIGMALPDLRDLSVTMVALFLVPFGIIIPLWLLTLHVTIRADLHGLRVSVWPLYRTSIPRSSVRAIDTQVGDALRHHGGFVPVAGPRDDRVLGFSQSSGVRIAFTSSDGEHQLTILTDRAEALAQAIRNASGHDQPTSPRESRPPDPGTG